MSATCNQGRTGHGKIRVPAITALALLGAALAWPARALEPPQLAAPQLAPTRSVTQPVELDARPYVATSDGLSQGAIVRLDSKPTPQWPLKTLADTDGGLVLRAFGPDLFALNAVAGTVTRVRRDGSQPPQVYAIGEASDVQDVHVVGSVAWVTRGDDPVLLKLDLASGAQTPSLDLSVLAAAGESTSLGMMERDGDRLFVQLRLALDPQRAPGPFFDRGLLAVVDLPSETLVDAQPSVPGLQGVALDGAPPHLKMQILDEVRTLYVSTTRSHLDERGGIEMVDLDRLQSVGYALSEQQISDIGGFVMTSPEGGWFVFHTDIVASTHLKPFTVAGGPSLEPELVVLFEFVDALAWDAELERVYLPSGYDYFNGGKTTGLYRFDAATGTMIGSGPIDTGLPPHDVLLLDP